MLKFAVALGVVMLISFLALGFRSASWSPPPCR
jgi:hypothetical protein